MSPNRIEKPENSEYPEKFSRVALKIRKPYAGFGWSFEYTADSIGICAAYNVAIEEIAKREKLHPFHQGGVDPKAGTHVPGWHKWEFFTETNENQLSTFIEEIHRLAEQKFIRDQKLGLHKYWGERLERR